MHRLLLTVAAVAGLATALPAAAQFQKPEDAVKYRQAGMTLIGAHFGRIGAMAQGKVPFDGATAAENADIVARLSALPFAAYVEGTAGTTRGSTSAKVWTERAKFDAAAKTMQDEVAKLALAAKANNVDALKAAFGAAGKSCKACHDDFRNH